MPDGGLAKLKRVVIRHIPEASAQRLALEKGDVDVAENLTPDQVTAIASNKDIKVTTVPQALLYYIGQAKWTSPITNKLLAEVGYSTDILHYSSLLERIRELHIVLLELLLIEEPDVDERTRGLATSLGNSIDKLQEMVDAEPGERRRVSRRSGRRR